MLFLSACGGGGSGSDSSTTPPTWTAGVFQPSSHFAAQCQNPRSGTDPVSGAAYPDVQGSTLDENNWLRSWSNELYLWYSEIPDVNPASYSTTASYFDVLKTAAITSTGAQGSFPLHLRHRGLGAVVRFRNGRRLRGRL
jgi:hypothetical protein